MPFYLLDEFTRQCLIKEIYWRLENDEEGYHLSIINRKVFPRIWADNQKDASIDINYIAASQEYEVEKALVGLELDWSSRYFDITIEGCCKQALLALNLTS